MMLDRFGTELVAEAVTGSEGKTGEEGLFN